MPGMPDTDAALEAHLDSTHAARLESYKAFLRIPSISALPEHADDCRHAAQWLADALAEAGLEHAEVAETGGHPVVYADWLHAPDAPTVIVYGHYDVQPVDPLELWTSPPFEPVVVGDRMLARGAADDKGQIHAHLMAAGGLLATRGRLPINVKYLFEGEEESSSAHLGAWLAAERERLVADVTIISDTGFFEGNLPAITLSLRGIMYAQIDVVGTDVDLHSGGYGGVVQNPANALARSSRRSRAPMAGSGSRASTTTSSRCPTPTARRSRRCRSTMRPTSSGSACRPWSARWGIQRSNGAGRVPTLDVNGLWGGFQGEGSKTIIPAHAHAKVSCRLVAAQDPDRIFEAFKAYVEEIAPPGVTTTVRLLGGGLPILTPMDHPATQAAARALEATFGQAPVYIREGGSIPVCASFNSILGHAVVLLGFVQPDSHAHAPNEWMDLGNYETSIRTIARTWDELVDLPR